MQTKTTQQLSARTDSNIRRVRRRFLLPGRQTSPLYWIRLAIQANSPPIESGARRPMTENPAPIDPQARAHKGQRTALGVDALAQSFLDNLFFVQGRSAGAGDGERPVHGAGAHGARPAGGAVDSDGEELPGAGCARGLLPVGGVFDRAAPGQQPDQSGHLRRDRAGDAAVGPRSECADRAGRGAGPGQRRIGPSGLLLHGFAGHAGYSGDRLRHSLRVRNLRPADSRRLAGGVDRQMAAAGQSLGAGAARGCL